MKLLFKQRFLTLVDSYDIYDEFENTVFTVKGKFSLMHKLTIFDACGREIGRVEQKFWTLLPTFELFVEGDYVGSIRKEFSMFHPRYDIDCNGWHAEGNFMEWDYQITDPQGMVVASISKELFHMTDTYVIDVARPKDALCVLMFVLAIDAEKCSRG